MDRYFHICARANWERVHSDVDYRPASLTAEGFIHLSLARQWPATANRFFRGRADLVLLEIEAIAIQADVRFEAADGDSFPHLYAALPRAAVVAVHDLRVKDDGTIATSLLPKA